MLHTGHACLLPLSQCCGVRCGVPRNWLLSGEDNGDCFHLKLIKEQCSRIIVWSISIKIYSPKGQHPFLQKSQHSSLRSKCGVYFVCQSGNTVQYNIDGLVQERCNSIAKVLELRLSCTNLSIWCHIYHHYDNVEPRTDIEPTKHLIGSLVMGCLLWVLWGKLMIGQLCTIKHDKFWTLVTSVEHQNLNLQTSYHLWTDVKIYQDME